MAGEKGSPRLAGLSWCQGGCTLPEPPRPTHNRSNAYFLFGKSRLGFFSLVFKSCCTKDMSVT